MNSANKSKRSPEHINEELCDNQIIYQIKNDTKENCDIPQQKGESVYALE